MKKRLLLLALLLSLTGCVRLTTVTDGSKRTVEVSKFMYPWSDTTIGAMKVEKTGEDFSLDLNNYDTDRQKGWQNNTELGELFIRTGAQLLQAAPVTP